MKRALAYRPRFNAPPRPITPPPPAASRPKTKIAPGIWWFLGAVLLVVAVARTVQGQGRTPGSREAFEPALAVATADSAWSRLAQSYYDTTFRGQDWPGVRTELRAAATQARSMAEVRAAITAMFARLGESHFALIPAESAGGWDEPRSEEGSLGDVGLEYRLLDGGIVVSRVEPGSPAARSGVRTGWTLERLGELEVAPFVRERLRVGEGSARRLAELQLPLVLLSRTQGAVGSVIPLVLRDGDGAARRVELRRVAVDAELVRYGQMPPLFVRFESARRAEGAGCVGVLRFNIWMTPVMPRLDDAMVAFRDCQGVIVDLRGNVGGVAAMVMGMGGYFLDSTASFGTMTTRGGALRYVSNPRRSDRAGAPLSPFGGTVAILVDGLSVSTSEIFAAGLQAMGRARVFGERTAGQALPSMLARLPNGDVMQYVVADFTAPDGRRIEAHGVVPDELLPLRRRALLDGRDEPLEAALRWMTGVPAAVSHAGHGSAVPARR